MRKSRQNVVIKRPLRDDYATEKAFRHEAIVAATLSQHPNIVRTLGACLEPSNMFFVMEHLPLDSIDQHMHYTSKRTSRQSVLLSGTEWRPVQLTYAQKVRSMVDIASGLSNMHAEGILHGDVACRNCLLAADLTST